MTPLSNLAILFLIAATSNALNCWVCVNAPNNDVCQLLGSLQKCEESEDACQNEIRTGDDGFRITKRCKQALACDNNFLQNTRAAWFPSQCNTETPSSVCRCCCNTNNCNWPAAHCNNPVVPVTEEVIAPTAKLEIGLTTEPKTVSTTVSTTVPTTVTTTVPTTVTTMMPTTVSTTVPTTRSTTVSTTESTTVPSTEPIADPSCETIVSPANAEKFCSNADIDGRSVLGTVCFFICVEGYELLGEESSSCERISLGEATFTNLPPICTPRIRDEPTTLVLPPPLCEPLQTPENGFQECTPEIIENGAELKSICRFDCFEGYILEGNDKSECVMDEIIGFPFFDREPPICVRNKLCDSFGPIEGGQVSCTNDNVIGSTCTFECNKGRHLFPANRTEVTCGVDNTWNGPPPCCVSSCPLTLMDLVIVMDSSGSIGEENWHILLKFVQDFLKDMVIGEDAARVSVVSYSGKVEAESRILLNQFQGNKKGLVRNINPTCFEWMAERTDTGNALDYVNKFVLNGRKGDRSDVRNVVLVITDGRSTDDVLRPAARLRRKAEIFALGIEPDSNFDYIDLNELREVAGSYDRVMFVRGGYLGLNDEISNHVKSHLCSKPTCGNLQEEMAENIQLHEE